MEPGDSHCNHSGSHKGILHDAVVHLVSGIVLSGVVLLLLSILVLFPPLRNLEHLGADHLWDYAISRIDDVWRPNDPRIVFISIDDSSLADWRVSSGLEGRSRIAGLISDLRNSPAAAIMVDIVFEASTADDRLLHAALQKDGVPVILAAPDAVTLSRNWESSFQIQPGPAYPSPLPSGVTFASARVLEDADGVVRSLRSAQCNRVDGQWRMLPSLARATAAVVLNNGRLEETACSGTTPSEPISFLIRPERGEATAAVAANPWFRTISAADVPKLPADFLRNTIVVLGQNNHQSNADKFTTPLGYMPGALVQANALAGRIRNKDLSHADDGEELSFELSLISVTAISGLIYLGISKSIRRRFADRKILGQKIAHDRKSSLFIFVLDSCAFFIIGLLSAIIIYQMTLAHGLVLLARGQTGLGDLLPVLGFGLEAMIDYGGPLMVWVEKLAAALSDAIFATIAALSRGVSFLVLLVWKRYLVRASVILALVLGCDAATAQNKPAAPTPAALLRVVAGDPDKVAVERPGLQSPLNARSVLDLYANDRVRVLDPATRVRVFYLGDQPDTLEIDGRLGWEHLVRLRPAAPESWPLWRALREMFDGMQRAPAAPREPRAASIAGITNLAGDTTASRSATSSPRLLEDTIAMSADSSGSAAAQGDWQIDLGSFDAEADARSAASATRMALGVRAGDVKVVPRQRGEARQYSARIANLDQLSALEACAKLRPRSACAVVSPEEAAAAVAPPLRHAGGLAEASYFIAAGEADFPVVWAGGTGPFAVQVLGPDGGGVLASQTVRNGRSARVAVAALGPAGQGRVRVVDQADGGAITLTVAVARQPKLSAGSLGQSLPLPAAAYLYSEAPGWRIEGLRRFMALAAAGDTDARQILDGVMAR